MTCTARSVAGRGRGAPLVRSPDRRPGRAPGRRSGFATWAEAALHRPRLEPEGGPARVERADVVDLSWRSWSVATGNGRRTTRPSRRRGGSPGPASGRGPAASPWPEGPPRRSPGRSSSAARRGGTLRRWSAVREHGPRPRARSSIASGWKRAAPRAGDRDHARRDPDEPRDEVEEPVARPEQQRRAEDRPVEPARRGRSPSPSPSSSRSGDRVVDDGRARPVDEPPDARVARRLTTFRVSLGVDEPEARAAVEVSRDRGQVDDRVDAGEAAGSVAGR